MIGKPYGPIERENVANFHADYMDLASQIESKDFVQTARTPYLKATSALVAR